MPVGRSLRDSRVHRLQDKVREPGWQHSKAVTPASQGRDGKRGYHSNLVEG